MGEKLKSFLEFVKLLRVEPYVLLLFISMSIKASSVQQLTQDKICINDLQHSIDICRTVATSTDPATEDIRVKIFTQANIYKRYSSLIFAIPGLITCLFLGPWTDRYLGARKILMLLGGLGFALNTAAAILNAIFFKWPTPYILLSDAFPGFFGGLASAMAAVYSYATINTPKHLLVIRFSVLQLLVFITQPMSGFIGGQIFAMEPFLFKDMLRNYMGVFILSEAAAVLCILWVVIFINEKPKEETTAEEVEPNPNRTMEEINSNEGCSESNRIEDTHAVAPKDSNGKMIRNIFDIKNVKNMLRVLTKKRPNYGHVQIWLVLYSLISSYFIAGAESDLAFVFAQRVYQWNVTVYSKYFSAGSLFTNISSIGTIAVLVKLLKLSNLSLGTLGILSISTHFAIFGTILSPTGYAIATLFGIFAPCATVGLKTDLTNLIDPSEAGSMFALISLGQISESLCDVYFYTAIFNAYITTNPGLAFEIGATMGIPPLVCLIWIRLYRSHINKRELASRSISDEADAAKTV